MDTIYDYSFQANNGEQIDLSQFRGQPLLIVNTASKCGFVGQYDGLQELHEEFGPQGLVVIGFPCDQFANQEFADDEAIEEFCRVNHGVTFPLSSKIDVNGSNTHPIFRFVKDRTKGLLGTRVKWNFTKFLVAADGVTVKRFAPNTEPAKLVDDVEAALSTAAA